MKKFVAMIIAIAIMASVAFVAFSTIKVDDTNTTTTKVEQVVATNASTSTPATTKTGVTMMTALNGQRFITAGSEEEAIKWFTSLNIQQALDFSTVNNQYYASVKAGHELVLIGTVRVDASMLTEDDVYDVIRVGNSFVTDDVNGKVVDMSATKVAVMSDSRIVELALCENDGALRASATTNEVYSNASNRVGTLQGYAKDVFKAWVLAKGTFESADGEEIDGFAIEVLTCEDEYEAEAPVVKSSTKKTAKAENNPQPKAASGKKSSSKKSSNKKSSSKKKTSSKKPENNPQKKSNPSAGGSGKSGGSSAGWDFDRKSDGNTGSGAKSSSTGSGTKSSGNTGSGSKENTKGKNNL
jgi:uncharacterized protein YxeA